MKVLITGANGFLGYYLCGLLLENGYEVIATGKGVSRLPYLGSPGFRYCEMDFTDPYAVHDVFELIQPAIVIHAGAMTKPDDCETRQWDAYLVNVEGTVNLLSNAEEQNAFFIFISTDFVFDGEKGLYTEDEPVAAVNYYGKTKIEAEQAVQDYAGDWAIVRTVLVYGKPVLSRANILSIVKDKLEKGEIYNVVDDQVRTPTFVGDLARGISLILEQQASGIFHISGAEVMTPYEMAIRTARFLGKEANLIKKVTAANFTQPAKRPVKTGFIIDKARQQLGFEPVSFEEGLAKTFG